MGIGGMGITELLIILAIILLLFGTKKLRNLGGDLGGAVKGFKKAMNDDDSANPQQINKADKQAIDGSTESKTSDKQNTQ